jgi:hypothetical protein
MNHADRGRGLVPDGTLIRGLHPAVYWVEHGKERPFIDLETFHSYGFNAKGIVELDESALEGIMGNGMSREKSGSLRVLFLSMEHGDRLFNERRV